MVILTTGIHLDLVVRAMVMMIKRVTVKIEKKETVTPHDLAVNFTETSLKLDRQAVRQ